MASLVELMRWLQKPLEKRSTPTLAVVYSADDGGGGGGGGNGDDDQAECGDGPADKYAACSTPAPMIAIKQQAQLSRANDPMLLPPPPVSAAEVPADSSKRGGCGGTRGGGGKRAAADTPGARATRTRLATARWGGCADCRGAFTLRVHETPRAHAHSTHRTETTRDRTRHPTCRPEPFRSQYFRRIRGHSYNGGWLSRNSQSVTRLL